MHFINSLSFLIFLKELKVIKRPIKERVNKEIAKTKLIQKKSRTLWYSLVATIKTIIVSGKVITARPVLKIAK